MRKPWLIFTLTGLLTLVVYIQTLAPTIIWSNDGADSGDLAAAVAVHGVPHPLVTLLIYSWANSFKGYR